MIGLRRTGHRSSGPLFLVFCMLVAAGPANSADVFNGQNKFTQHCAQCHGSDGRGTLPGAPNFQQGERLTRPDTALLQSIRDGAGVMPGFNGVLKDEEILDVIAYIRTLTW